MPSTSHSWPVFFRKSANRPSIFDNSAPLISWMPTWKDSRSMKHQPGTSSSGIVPDATTTSKGECLPIAVSNQKDLGFRTANQKAIVLPTASQKGTMLSAAISPTFPTANRRGLASPAANHARSSSRAANQRFRPGRTSFAFILFPMTVVLLSQIMFAAAMSTASSARDDKCLKDLRHESQVLQVDGNSHPLVLGSSANPAHLMASHVIKIFLEEALGYQQVLVNTENGEGGGGGGLDEERGVDIFMEAVKPLSPTSDGDPPEAIINPTVILPPGNDIDHWISSGHIEDYGPLGPVARLGWFIPESLIPEDMVTIEHWRTLQNRSLVAMMDLEHYGPLSNLTEFTIDSKTGRYFCEESYCQNGMFKPDACKPVPGGRFRHHHQSQSSDCALLIAGYPEEAPFLKDHINDMNLLVKVAFTGPHKIDLVKSVTKQLSRSPAGSPDTSQKAGQNGKMVLFFGWAHIDLTSSLGALRSVFFPSCDSVTPPVAPGCYYLPRPLHKLAWSGLKRGAKVAGEALQHIHFTQDQFEDLLSRYLARKPAEGWESLACKWMQENRKVWRGWIPVGEEQGDLYIGGIFPISGDSYTAKGTVIAATMAIDAINANQSVLPNYNLRLYAYDSQCKADIVMKSFIDYIRFNYFHRMVGILGPACSDTAEPLAGVSKHFKTVVISYSAEGASFNDRTKYPYFFRTIGENNHYSFVFLNLFKTLGWGRVASLTEEGQKYAEYLALVQDQLHSQGVHFISNRKFHRDKASDDMTEYLTDLKNKRARIIIGEFYDTTARSVMCAAYHLQMTAKQGYVWFLPQWFAPDWYDTDQLDLAQEELVVLPGRLNKTSNGASGTHYTNGGHKRRVSCTTAQMIEAINGHLGLHYSYFASDNSVMQESETVGEWKSKYNDRCKVQGVAESIYAGFAYDAVWTYALSLDKLLRQNQSHIANLHSDSTTRSFVELINATDFYGVSGHIKFYGGPSRISDIDIVQWRDNQTNVVGSFKPNISKETGQIIGGDLVLNKSALVWLNPGGVQPTDGAAPPPPCTLDWLAKSFNIDCHTAIIVANVIGFCVLAIFLISCFIIVKRRYEQKMRKTQEYYRNLGIDLLSATNLTSLDEWEMARDRVVINRKLGEGAFGTVYGGEAFFEDKGWMAIAVKTLKIGSSSEEKLDFLSEAEVMKRFDHKNIVRLLGVCTRNEPVYTIMEFMLYGDLKTYLLARRHLVKDKTSEESDEVSSKRLTAMGLDIARGLSYLAEMKFVHRDVACRNCLVNACRVVKLGDFGMTRPMFENDYYRFSRRGMLPVRWMSPESLSLGIFTPASDVWSYGILLYEIITFGSFPFQGLSNNQVLEHVKQGNSVTVPDGLKPQLETLLQSCWRLEPKDRPSASEIVEYLASNPRLLAPNLDVPLSSVQLEATDQLEMHLDLAPKINSVGPIHLPNNHKTEGDSGTPRKGGVIRARPSGKSLMSSKLPLPGKNEQRALLNDAGIPEDEVSAV